MRPKNTKPDGGNHRVGIAHKGNSEYLAALIELYRTDKPSRIPDNWRDRLPDSLAYYSQHVSKLGRVNSTGWAQGVCPFHEDNNASLSVNITGGRGLWRCFAGCGAGDMLGFHMRRTGLDFKAAVRDLIGSHA